MATRFLPAGAFRDLLKDIYTQSRYIKRLLELNDNERNDLVARYASEGYYTSFYAEVEKTVVTLSEHTDHLWRLINSFECEPLIFTGEGSTEEVIGLLTELLDRHFGHL